MKLCTKDNFCESEGFEERAAGGTVRKLRRTTLYSRVKKCTKHTIADMAV